jgi:microcystin degradation protein MlrC
MRLVALATSRETNTFARVPVSYARFEQDGVLRGDEIRRVTCHPAWLFGAGRQTGVQVVHLLFTQTNSIGTITSDAFERIVGEMQDSLRKQVRGTELLHALHGAAVSEDCLATVATARGDQSRDCS